MKYLILSHHTPTHTKDLTLWWCAKSSGYTADVRTAGRYSKREAQSIVGDGEENTMFSESEVVRMAVKMVRFDALPFEIRKKRR